MFNGIIKKEMSKVDPFNKAETAMDNYCDSIVLFNSKKQCIILFRYTNNYLPDLLDLYNASNVVVNTALLYHIDTSYYDEEENTIHAYNYLLLSADDFSLAMLITNCVNIGNAFYLQLVKIVNKYREIEKNITYDLYDTIIKNTQPAGFKPTYDKDIELVVSAEEDITADLVSNKIAYIPDLKIISSRLPKNIGLTNIVYGLKCTIAGISHQLRSVIHRSTARGYKKEHIGYQIMSMIVGEKNNTKELAIAFTEPRMIAVDLEDDAFGDIDESDIDDLFKQSYDSYKPVKETNVKYEDIDEVLEVLNDEQSDNNEEPVESDIDRINQRLQALKNSFK